jgi:branched-subunit amino acid transport protein AzlD
MTESRRYKIPWRAILPPLVTVSIFILIFRKVPFAAFTNALREADYVRFATALLPFSVFYFTLDAVVLWRVVRWFHGELALADLLPVRAVDYLLSILNHRVSQGAMVVYLARRLSTSLLEIASSILFLDLLQRTHLILWAGIGMALVSETLPTKLLFVPLGLLAIWAVFLNYVHGGFAFLGQYLSAPDWRLFRTFRLAAANRYAHVLLLKAPLLLVAVFAHYHATRAFGFEIPMPRLLATLPIIFMVGSLPINVARLGTTPLAWIYFHGDVVAPPKLLAYSLAGHLTFMLANAALGLVFLPRAYRELFSERIAASEAPAA